MGSFWKLLKASVLEMGAFAILLPIRFFPFFELKPVGNPKGRPILLVHGYLDNCFVLAYYRWRLKSAGLGPVYSINLGNPFLSIREYARRVKRQAERIAKEAKRNDLILIGHSMGGIVSMLYATELAPPGTVTDLIAIGSPIRGTPMAQIALGTCSKEMMCGSPLLKEVQKGIDLYPEIRFFYIAAKWDMIVFPTSTSLYGHDRAKQYTIDDLGHLSLLFSKRVTDKIVQWLFN